MDEILDVLDLFADLGLDGVVVWLFRLLGFVLVLAGIALWLLADIGILVPAALVVVGFLLLVVPGLVFELLEIV
jgi:hypothetical protein